MRSSRKASASSARSYATLSSEPRAGVVHELDGLAERVRRASVGVGGELGGPVGVVGELGRAGGDAREVAVPQARRAAGAWSMRLRARPALGPPRLLAELRLAPLVLLAGQELELLGQARLVGVARGGAARRRGLEHAAPRPLGRRRVPCSGARAKASARARRAAPSPSARASARSPSPRLSRAAAAACSGAAPRASRRSASTSAGTGVEAHGLAARGDRGQDLARAVREEEQHHVGRRLLQRLEQGVGRLVVHRVGPLEHEHAVGGLERRVRGRGRPRPRPRRGAASRARRWGRPRSGRDGRRAAPACARRRRPPPRGPAARRPPRGRPRACRSRPGRAGGTRARGGRRRPRRAPRRRADGARARRGARARSVVACATWPAGRLITVEGIDGAGKTTLVGGLEPALRARGGRGRRAARAGRRGAVGAHPRARQGSGAGRWTRGAEALLYAAARAQLVAERLRPLLDGRPLGAARPLRRLLARLPGRRARAGRRGGARGSTSSRTGGLAPDRTLLLRIDPARGLARLAGGATRPPTGSSASSAAFFARGRAAYDALAAAEPERFAVIDAAQAPGRRAGRVRCAALEPLLGQPRVAAGARLVPGPGVGDHLVQAAARRPAELLARARSAAATSSGGSPGRRGSSCATRSPAP